MITKFEISSEQFNGYIPVHATKGKLEKQMIMRIISKINDSNVPEISPINENAACVSPDIDPEIFFPEGRRWTLSRIPKADEAKKICDGCQVNIECRNYSIMKGDKLNNSQEDNGILGGLDQFERQDISDYLRKIKPIADKS